MIQLLSYTTGSTLTYYAFLYSLLLNTFALCVDSDRKEEPPGEAIFSRRRSTAWTEPINNNK